MAALLPSVTAIRKRPFLHLKRPSAQEAMLPTVNTCMLYSNGKNVFYLVDLVQRSYSVDLDCWWILSGFKTLLSSDGNKVY